MTTLAGASNLATVIEADITMANITALTNKPIIRLAGGSDVGTGDIASGELILEREIYKQGFSNLDFRDERYTIPATLTLEGQTSDTTFKEYIVELARIIDAKNKLAGHTYNYVMEYEWDTNINIPVAHLTFIMTKMFEAIAV